MATAPTTIPSTARARHDRAVALCALTKWADKEGDRNELEAGASYDISLAISGTVDGRSVSDSTSGRLLVNHDQQVSSSSGPKPAEVLAVFLAEIPERRRQKLLETIPDQYLRAGGQLDEVNQELLSAAERLFDRLRTTTTVPRRGSVRYEPAAHP